VGYLRKRLRAVSTPALAVFEVSRAWSIMSIPKTSLQGVIDPKVVKD
jgi:hypothetical protein